MPALAMQALAGKSCLRLIMEQSSTICLTDQTQVIVRGSCKFLFLLQFIFSFRQQQEIRTSKKRGGRERPVLNIHYQLIVIAEADFV